MRRSRRSAIALIAACALTTGLAMLNPLANQPSANPPETSNQTEQASAPTVVPGRYFVQTADAGEQARLLAEISRIGASVVQSYDTLWSGVSVAATDSQLEQIESVTGPDAVSPVYELHLSDPAPTQASDEDGSGSETATVTPPIATPTTPAAAGSVPCSPTASTMPEPAAEPTATGDPEPSPTAEPAPANDTAAPMAVDDEAITKQNTAAVVTPLANDLPGGKGEPRLRVPFLADSLVLLGADGYSKTANTPAGRWSVSDDAAVTFTPEPDFVGVESIEYRISDADGAFASATIAVTVTAVVPVALPDCVAVPAQHTATINPLENDSAGDPGAPLVPSSVELASGDTFGDSPVTTPDGTWSVGENGTVSFAPTDTFHGNTTTVSYRVRDTNGTATKATISVRVGSLTTATDVSGSTPQNTRTALTPLEQVVIGDDGNGRVGSLQLDSMRFADSADTPGSGRTLLARGVGTWEIDSAVGGVIFRPEPGFTGTANATYAITDSFGNTARATLSVAVTPSTPGALDDEANTAANHPVTIDVLANDQKGAVSAPLVAASLKLLSTDADTGTWTLTEDHKVTFAPSKDFTGLATAKYQVLDENTTPATGTIRVTVGALPKATNDLVTAPQTGEAITIDPMANDLAGDDGLGESGRGTLTASSVVLTNSAATNGGRSLTSSLYSWTVGDDGKVTFEPDWRYQGTTSVTYRVTDSFGNTATAEISVSVTPTVATETEQRLKKIGALRLDDVGKGVKVGIIDSGVDYTHPDLGGSPGTQFPTSRVTAGYDFVDRDDLPMDCYGHGTKVAGVVGADGNPKLGGAYGVAPKVTFGAYRVFDCSGTATTDSIIKAMERAAKDGMHVVNLSLGASSVSWPNDPLSQAAANLVKKGVVVVAAAGNSGAKGLFTSGSPAVAPGVISLAAANNEGTGIESFSSMGLAADLSLSPTLAAPGSAVHTTALNGSYASPSGTSVAAPGVAGAVAQILAAKGWTTRSTTIPARTAALLYASANQVNATTSAVRGRPEAVFRQGAGLLDVSGALSTSVTASPSMLKLGDGSSRTATITLTNAGTSSVTYKISAVTGASAAASTGSKTNLGSQTPSWAYAAVGFKATPSSVTVPAGKTAKVSVKITPSTKILSGKQGMLYGGWVKFTASGKPTVSVPFAGLRGTYQKVKLLPSATRTLTEPGVSSKLKLPGLAYQSSNSSLHLTTSGTRTFRPGKAHGQPYVLFHLDYPASAIRLKAINQKTKKSYYAVLSGTSTQFGKRGRDESYTAIAFYGAYKNSKKKVVAVPAGTYKLQLRVLAPLGSSSKSSHWQTYTTRAFKLSWK